MLIHVNVYPVAHIPVIIMFTQSYVNANISYFIMGIIHVIIIGLTNNINIMYILYRIK